MTQKQRPVNETNNFHENKNYWLKNQNNFHENKLLVEKSEQLHNRVFKLFPNHDVHSFHIRLSIKIALKLKRTNSSNSTSVFQDDCKNIQTETEDLEEAVCSFIPSGDLYSASLRHYYSEVLPAQCVENNELDLEIH